MNTAHVVVTVLAALMSGYSGAALLTRAQWVVQILAEYKVPSGWWPWLGAAKAAGALGLLVGLFVPVVGTAATIGLALYYGGAVITVARARWYSHIPFPLVYLAPAVTAYALGLAA
ncbi:DoxX family protein [Kitasatospora sp. NPDC002040]|uniref:DoxX family protein n=1 Tax=Kitasatospora sp. NPDC002040 TaxID=3154661 RepID=UPI0033234195